jgi:hypothetical protein
VLYLRQRPLIILKSWLQPIQHPHINGLQRTDVGPSGYVPRVGLRLQPPNVLRGQMPDVVNTGEKSKIESRKISRMPNFGDLSRCKARQNRYVGRWSLAPIGEVPPGLSNSHLGKSCRLLTNSQRCPSRRSSHLAAPCVEHEWSWQAESRELTARRNILSNARSANSPKRKSAVTRPTPGAIARPGSDERSRQRDRPSTL